MEEQEKGPVIGRNLDELGGVSDAAADGMAVASEERRRDPEDRPVSGASEEEAREKGLDKTLADSFPTSDPPSSIPDPAAA